MLLKPDNLINTTEFLASVRAINGHKAIWKVRAFSSDDYLKLKVDPSGLVSIGGWLLFLCVVVTLILLWAIASENLEFQATEWDPLYWSIIWLIIIASYIYGYALAFRRDVLILKGKILTVTRKNLWWSHTDEWDLNKFACLYVYVNGRHCSLSALNEDDIRAEMLGGRSYYTLSLLAALIREDTGLPELTSKYTDAGQPTLKTDTE